MHAVDRAILEHCVEHFQPLSDLRKQLPQGSLYRHVNLLRKLGLLEKQASFYRATEGGRRALVTASTQRTFDGFADVYAPIAEVPTPTHRVMAELIFAAAVARHHQIRADRHPFFGAIGQTLRWKSSLGQFCCYALGLDPAHHLVECGSETGKSLAIRRDHEGKILFKRALLDASFVVLDEFLCAEPSARPSLHLFLSGRLEMPFENSRLTIKPVPLLTFNPHDRPTLEERLGLSPPQIRRGLIANFDAVPLPDLAMTGERALLAAQQHPPLILGPPKVDCGAYQPLIVQTLRQILTPAAQSRVDVQVIITLCTGMTAFIEDAEASIIQVVYGVGMMAETMQWTNCGWIDAVLHCSVSQGRARPHDRTTSAEVGSRPSGAELPDHSDPGATISLDVPRLRRETSPLLGVSEELKNRLIWAAVDTGQSLEEALTALLDLYLLHRTDSNAIASLKKVLSLADHLQLAHVEVTTLGNYLAAEVALGRAGLWMDDVPQALRLIPLLEGLPKSWTWKQAHHAMCTVTYVLRHGIDLDQIGEFLVFHHRLEEYGITERYLADLVEALEHAGVEGPRKKKTLDRLMEQAATGVEIEELTHQAQQGSAECKRLVLQRDTLRTSLEDKQRELHALREEATALQDRLKTLTDEVTGYEQERLILQAIRLLREPEAPVEGGSVADREHAKPQEHTQPTSQAAFATPQQNPSWEALLAIFQQRAALHPRTGNGKI